ncbi:UDP-N-acetylmuramoyl-tripeptide--D-alanyl-D-alanine ligase [Ruegeria pomeroyi]|uniref:UDP-N-acetylmuramoyl-tripeptide--D-alanyl-D-alanine ligase n=2 Tax=Ruegeria pomeroyi TaxID=89184 RepID=Q5LU75_RUEPO|nr:UDP-N-acetylmuramoyl-tripeptide--D-alanyl-D-alanine ligase [Ruegeria pomeroyi]AAV94479.1 UDP-N-acetylmuramoyl-tripeptide--D-alanyl-D-alanine ligase [Ruegeria pomeroyi DSS-3]NVK96740.1 UDP-N-acetylmuramoyl-tripeptide--D-alanyl-D-alanine ligase [Ruegeria pomeroyi]NVL04101.1 UDP-N-acetylmuramoyl-tripeptide--D-alanyl-D-alanine ligase [Ruegeria pomeroyi]QWV08060.1 UDP-N-acetylmuramoyl-tripeptide--D-alanyl-D-alanine ligase [Ruegeria pomeroyi]
MTLWTAAEAAEATGGRALGDWQVSGISIDTRTIAPGDLFVALTAARDGHDFVAQALDKGAGAALVSRIPEGVGEDGRLLLVDDVQTGLEALGRAGRARAQARVVAVTGSVGKTSTKEMLAAMLGAQGRTHASVASYNNHWGVPLTLARMPRDTEFAVIEIGMNHPGEIAPLARQARPHVAMVTTVAAVHLEAFDDVAGIAREKAAIMEGLEPGGVAVLNADIAEADILRAAARGARQLSFGRAAQDYRLTGVEVADGMTHARADTPAGPVSFTLQSAGTHFAMNALGALACCDALGADAGQSLQGLERWTPYKGRGARETISLAGGPVTLFDDSYNANPTSVGAALEVLAGTPGTRRVAFLGDMKELGPEELPLHAGLAALPAMERVDQVHCIGPLMRALFDALPEAKRGRWTETGAEMLAELPALVAPGDAVLVKGSLSMGLARLVDGLREMGHGAGSKQSET